jgi:HK97 gp10 family phage protein
MVRDNAIMAGITTEAQFFFIPKQGADDEMEDRFLEGLIKGAQKPDSATGDIAVPVSGGVGVSRGEGGQFASAGGKRPQVVVGSSSGYGGYLELGTSRMQPFPYIRPAMEANKSTFRKELTGIL